MFGFSNADNYYWLDIVALVVLPAIGYGLAAFMNKPKKEIV
jgi:hypothetical protein